MQLLCNDAVAGVDCSDYRGSKEGETLDSDVDKKVNEDVRRVTGLQMPRRIFGMSSLSKTSVMPTRSDLMQAMQRSFFSSENHLAVSGRSVKVKKEIRAGPQVVIPSIANFILHWRRPPKLDSFRMPAAKTPPKAPARGDMTM